MLALKIAIHLEFAFEKPGGVVLDTRVAIIDLMHVSSTPQIEPACLSFYPDEYIFTENASILNVKVKT